MNAAKVVAHVMQRNCVHVLSTRFFCAIFQAILRDRRHSRVELFVYEAVAHLIDACAWMAASGLALSVRDVWPGPRLICAIQKMALHRVNPLDGRRGRQFERQWSYLVNSLTLVPEW